MVTSAQRMSPGLRGAAVAVLGAGLGVVVFAAQQAPREAVVLWLACLALTTGVVALACRSAPRWRAVDVLRFALAGGAILRLAALVAPLSLSDDAHRYVWDGTLVARGLDPFLMTPRQALDVVPGLDLARFALLNSPDYYSVYPPLLQLTFASAVQVAGGTGLEPTWLLRVVFVGSDLAFIAILHALLGRFDRPRWWLLLYALHPLAVWEVAAGGHGEALMLPFLGLAIVAVVDRSGPRAGVALGLAASSKLTVLILGPVLLVALLRRASLRAGASFSVAAAIVLGAGLLPFWSPSLVTHVGESLALYRDVFSFNAPLFYALRWRLGYIEGETDPVDVVLAPWLTGLTLLSLGFAALGAGRRHGLAPGLAAAWLGYHAFARVVHPWYLLPLLALGLLAGSRAPLVLGAAVLLSYLRYDPIGHEAWWVLALQPFFFAVAVLLELWAHRVLRIPRTNRVRRWSSAPA